MAISDEYMQQMLTKTKPYSIVLLKPTGNSPANLQQILWEHARRNFSLREQGVLAIVCPVRAETSLSGLGIFTADEEETRKIMDGDPAVQAGIFVYEIHPCISFPGDCLS